MHTGFEARSPLLDHELIEFCARLPARMKVRRGVAKYFLKRMAAKYLPPDIVYRKKHGFDAPIVSWMRGTLRDLLEEVCRDPSAMAPLNVSIVGDTLDDFLLRDRDYPAPRLWSLLMYGLWRREESLL
jgi:asparagine synthase (glutamine-hydrolysing)